MNEPPQTAVLVVDSNPETRQALASRLGAKGYKVLEAADEASAASLVPTEELALVLVDVSVGAGRGIEVLRALRAQRSALELPVVVLTERPDQQDALEALDAGASDCITKPVDAAIVAARVEIQLRLHAAVATARKPTPPPAPPPPPKDEPLTPDRIVPGTVLAGKYQIESRVGTGSFGSVYRGKHLDLDTPIAVKVLQREVADTADARARLQREAISTCRIQHPNAVAVTDFGVQGEVVYLVMELLTGRSLQDELALTGRQDVTRAIEIVLPVLSVLAAAHANGVIHRDIKPANIFLHHTPRGEVVKVLDFGIAKLLDSPQQTMLGVVLGTPGYMAPERFKGAPSDPSGDVYSLATMLYQMLTGKLPFLPTSRHPMALAEMKLKQDAPSMRAMVPEIPEAVESLVLAALARDVSLRPSAAELAVGLAQAVGLPVPVMAGGPVTQEPAAEGGDIEPAEATAILPAQKDE